MLCGSWRVFLTDEAGGGTIWGLLWFILMVGICGLAVDSTDGFRNRTMLQATADASALAAAVDVDDANAAVATAVTYSVANMGIDINGSVLDPADVHVGRWDQATLSLDTGSPTPDAVMVTVRRSEENDNAVPVNFLRIIGLMTWNVNAQAVAQRFIPECLREGLIARGIVDISANNGFHRQICVHGQKGVEMQNHNIYELGVTVSMPDLDMLTIPSGGMTSNPGLPQALRENSLDPRMVSHVNQIMADLVAKADYGKPEVFAGIDPAVQRVDEKFNFATYVPNTIYLVECTPNKLAKIPNNLALHDVVIVSQCNVSVGSNVSMTNVVLGSTALGNGANPLANANINFSANVSLGAPDNCAAGGGVQLFSSASIHFSSSMLINGLQVVAAGDVELGARDQGINGISVQAGGNIDLTSNNVFGLCAGGAPNLFTVDYYRLVL